jgi:hypothetical protein
VQDFVRDTLYRKGRFYGFTDTKLLDENSVFIYPNPANDHIIVKSNIPVLINKIKIYNNLGQVVRNQIHTNNVIDVSILRRGLYIIEIGTDKFVYRKKLLVR